MFKKLVANLAFSPTMIDQVSFYGRRLKQEESIRRLGVWLIVFSMFIQVFAAMVPPERSLAASNNDVIRGGVQNIGQLKSKSQSAPDVKALYDRFGLQANSMNANGSARNTSFNFQEQGSKGTRTVGRINFASTKDNNLGSFAGSTFYSRNAGEWQGSTPAYYFDKQRGTDGHYYYVWVLKDCGNIAYRRADAPPPPKPEAKPVPQPDHIPKPPTPTPSTVPALQIAPPPPAPTPPPPVTTPPPAPPATPPPTPQTPPERSKSATNATQRLNTEKTLVTPAKAGDVIEYILTTRNTNNTDIGDYVVEDYVGDLLDYADLDMAFLTQNGGTYVAEEKVVRWKNQTIPAYGELKNSFRVTLKSTIPSTNTPNATATDYDCKMQNGYGNETVVPVDCSVLKTIETLPNTGPGTTIGIAFTVSVLSGYFFMRSRLLAKEVMIIKKTHQSGMGY